MTLAQLAITVALLGGLGLVAARIGLSAIPAYLLAGLLLGPNEPKALSLIRPSDVTTFVAEIGIIFLLFFLGLEFTLGRLARSRRHVLLGGAIDFAANATFGLIVGLAAFAANLVGQRLGRIHEQRFVQGRQSLQRRVRPRPADAADVAVGHVEARTSAIERRPEQIDDGLL